MSHARAGRDPRGSDDDERGASGDELRDRAARHAPGCVQYTDERPHHEPGQVRQHVRVLAPDAGERQQEDAGDERRPAVGATARFTGPAGATRRP